MSSPDINPPKCLHSARNPESCQAKEVIQLSFETPMFDSEGPPPGNPRLVQELIDWGLIEVHFKHVHAGASRSQRESWAEYCADLSLPSIRAWELWREAFIAEQEGVAHVFAPGEGFEGFAMSGWKSLGIRLCGQVRVGW